MSTVRIATWAMISTTISVISMISVGGCASAPANRKVSAVEEALSCRTPGIMDSGYTVSILPGDGAHLHGTIATVSAWGSDKPLYDGAFTVEVVKGTASKGCYTQLKGVAHGAKSATVEEPSIVSEGDGRKSTMTLSDGGVSHDLMCKMPKALLESLQKCEAERKQESASSPAS